ncbi:MAG TPA: class I SAM-dependent methyltransferase [Candidatus Saccharimonadales bacterium]|nr:class I SAM-dependent methyltransferase [Candidatus Saccharimonadales bacterium]
MIAIEQHQEEIHQNLKAWERKPLLQGIYEGFYERISQQIDENIPGLIVEIGSGIGNLKRRQPRAICTDLFPNPWLDLVCDGYELPFASGALSHLVLFDVFHHLRAPLAFLAEARRALGKGGRLILFEPYISLASFPVYGGLHHEPVAWKEEISSAEHLQRPRDYYAAQGNATRLFFGDARNEWKEQWLCLRAEAFSAFNYLLSGGYSKPALYPARLAGALLNLDKILSRWPRLFGGRCLVTLTPRA